MSNPKNATRRRGFFSRLFGYDATEEKQRRQSPVVTSLSEDGILDTGKRAKLVSTTRDLQRNFSIAAWAIRKHLDYVSDFRFQCRTGNAAVDRLIEGLVKWWSLPGNFEISGRHSRQRCIRLLEQGRTLDGDIFILKLSNGMIQPIEGDRICNPRIGVPATVALDEFTQGVKTTEGGRPQAYIIASRSKTGAGMEYLRIVPARHLEQHAFFTRIDQIRGVSPLAPAINTFKDVYESFEYALAKAKVAQMLGIVFKREAPEPIGLVTAGGGDEGEEAQGPRYKVDLGRGPVAIDLEPGDDASLLESNTPATEFQTFTSSMIGASLKALDIPYSFFDESFTNYSGARQALLQYEQSAAIKRQDVKTILDRLTAWRLRLFAADGFLPLPADMPIESLAWEWIPAGLPWIDPLKEVQADSLTVEKALNSRQRICKARGVDFFEIADELAQETEYLARKGVSTQVTAIVTPPEGERDGGESKDD